MRVLRNEPLTFAEQLRLEAALDEAFAPIRERRTNLSPARVRAALRWEPRLREAPPVWRGVALAGRLAESSLAVGLTALIFVATLGPLADPETRPASQLGPGVVQILDQAVDEHRARMQSLRVYRPAPIVDVLDPSRPLITQSRTPAPARPTNALLMR
ncbi:MAG: hypothetical protein ACRDGE_06960 [Candidatus Limnocylindria bacterium]